MDASKHGSRVRELLDELKPGLTLQQAATVAKVRVEVQALCAQLSAVTLQASQLKHELGGEHAQLESLRQANFVLQQRVNMEQEKAVEHQTAASRMAASLEADSERQFNELTRGDSGSEEFMGRARAGSVGSMSASSARFVRSASGTHLAAAVTGGSITPLHGNVSVGSSRSPSPAPSSRVATLDAAALAGLQLQGSAHSARRASFQALFDDDLDAMFMGTPGVSRGGSSAGGGQPGSATPSPRGGYVHPGRGPLVVARGSIGPAPGGAAGRSLDVARDTAHVHVRARALTAPTTTSALSAPVDPGVAAATVGNTADATGQSHCEVQPNGQVEIDRSGAHAVADDADRGAYACGARSADTDLGRDRLAAAATATGGESDVAIDLNAPHF